MAAGPTVDPAMAGGAPDAGAAPASPSPQAPSQGQPNRKQLLLAQLYELCKKLGEQDPVLSAGLQKAAQGIQEAQTALVTQPQPQPLSSNPPY